MENSGDEAGHLAAGGPGVDVVAEPLKSTGQLPAYAQVAGELHRPGDFHGLHGSAERRQLLPGSGLADGP